MPNFDFNDDKFNKLTVGMHFTTCLIFFFFFLAVTARVIGIFDVNVACSALDITFHNEIVQNNFWIQDLTMNVTLPWL